MERRTLCWLRQICGGLVGANPRPGLARTRRPILDYENLFRFPPGFVYEQLMRGLLCFSAGCRTIETGMTVQTRAHALPSLEEIYRAHNLNNIDTHFVNTRLLTLPEDVTRKFRAGFANTFRRPR